MATQAKSKGQIVHITALKWTNCWILWQIDVRNKLSTSIPCFMPTYMIYFYMTKINVFKFTLMSIKTEVILYFKVTH